LSDDIGEKKSKLWEILGSRAKSKDEFDANIDALMNPPEDRRKAQTLGSFSDFVDCVKAELKVTGENEFIVYGHTHQPFIDLEKRVANTGCWIKGANPSNTYFEFARWPPRVVRFKGEPLEPRSISALNF
jgi:hypothetical protein